MRKIVSVSILSLFILWILPLGAFIGPSQEKIACGGLRAICLCSHRLTKATSHTLEHSQLQGNSGAPLKENPSGGASHDFVTELFRYPSHPRIVLNTCNSPFIYRNPHGSPLEQVPKV